MSSAELYRICFEVVNGSLVGSTIEVHVISSSDEIATSKAHACVLHSFSDDGLTSGDLRWISTTQCLRHVDIRFKKKA